LWQPSSDELNPASVFMLGGLTLIVIMIFAAVIVHFRRGQTRRKS
jgi:hypothetical protein